jgi:hypothetical protein
MLNPNAIGDVPRNPLNDFALEAATEARASTQMIGKLMLLSIGLLICVAVGLISYARGIDREQALAEKRLQAAIEGNGTITLKNGKVYTCAWYAVKK